MSTVTVYEFEVWNPEASRFDRANTLATRDAIVAADGLVLLHTAREVDTSVVSSDGVVVRWPAQGNGESG